MGPVHHKLTGHAPERLLVLGAALLFSTGGAAVKASTLSGWQVASLRSGVAALTLLLILPAARRGWGWRPALVGLAYAGTMITYVLANKLTTAANAIFLQSTAPLYVLMLSPLLLGEKVRRRQLFFVVILAFGMGLFFVGSQPSWASAPRPVEGNMVAVAAGIFWALTIIGLRWLGRDSSGRSEVPTAATAVACGNLLACLVTLPLALPVRDATAVDWTVVVFLGVFQIAVAYVWLVRGMRRVGALESSLLLLLEPVLNPCWAWLIHGEQPTVWALAGGVIILSATVALAASGRGSEPASGSS